LDDASDLYAVTPRGRAFLEGKAHVIAELDRIEGLDEVLSILSSKTRAMRGDLLPEWGAFLKENSKFGTVATIKDTLRRRIVNLVERGFIDRVGNSYAISVRGREYLATLGADSPRDTKREVNRAIGEYNQAQRILFRERLATVAPARFERIVRDLLEAMGYEDVQVTRQSGDKGVDVVGTVQFGITTVTEVVQAKRHKGSINRPVLDQLRGALPYHKAIRGTIITLGSFTRGCTEAAVYTGAAPITLIDGERLIDLLVEHEVGVSKRPTPLIEIDESYFENDEETIAVERTSGLTDVDDLHDGDMQ
jgi:restriction system protein